jgi:hypothetical protein
MSLLKRASAAAGVAALSVMSVAGPAQAVASSYTILRGSASYLIAGNNLWPNGVDDAVKQVSLPFAVSFYGSKARTSVWVSSNGNLQFGPQPSTAWSNSCLPTSTGSGISGPAIFAYWDDIYIRPQSSSGDGVFTKTSGKKGSRTFIVSWKGVLFNDADFPVRAEAVFFEGKPYFETRYGAGDGGSATVGIENYYRTDATAWSCDDAVKAPDPGQSLRFSYTR